MFKHCRKCQCAKKGKLTNRSFIKENIYREVYLIYEAKISFFFTTGNVKIGGFEIE